MRINVALLLQIALISIFLSTPIQIAHAQVDQVDLSEILPEEVLKQLNGVDLEAVARGKIPPPNIKSVKADRDADWISTLPITLHLRGVQGSPLPEKKLAAKQREDDDDQEFRIVKQPVRQQRDPLELKALPECGKDSSTFESFKTEFGKGSLQDLLFIAPSQIPTDANEAYGKKTIIIPYDLKTRPAKAYWAKHLEVRCLPTRIRILSRGIARAEGLPALKNYDDNPFGQGVLHESAKYNSKRLFDQSGNSL